MSNTIIGDPVITPDGTTIIPVSKVSFGFASGGTDLPTKDPKQTFGGGGGAGITLQPLAFFGGEGRGREAAADCNCVQYSG